MSNDHHNSVDVPKHDFHSEAMGLYGSMVYAAVKWEEESINPSVLTTNYVGTDFRFQICSTCLLMLHVDLNPVPFKLHPLD